MARYKSINEFRAALSGAIGVRPNPQRKQRRSRARENPIRRLADGSEFEGTVDEVMEWEERRGGSRSLVSGATRRPTPSEPGESYYVHKMGEIETRAEEPSRRRSAWGRPSGAFAPKKKAAAPRRGAPPPGPFKDLWAAVMSSAGGFRALCPDLEVSQFRSEGMTAMEGYLRHLGMDAETLEHVADIMLDKEVLQTESRTPLGEKGPERDKIQADARSILIEVGGIKCPTAKKNPRRNGRVHYTIPLAPHYQIPWAQQPKHANWTSDPEYSYTQFYRANPSAAKAKAVRWAVPKNAGPYLPIIYPYGSGGIPEQYVFRNPKSRKNRGPRGGFSAEERADLPPRAFLKPSSRGWPVYEWKGGRLVKDLGHADTAVQYMTRGWGDEGEYPSLIKKLAKVFPVEDAKNKALWSKYRRLRTNIEGKAGRAMPTVSQLRQVSLKAAANPKRRRRSRRRR